ncbi:MAG: DUF123 domain-containing protein [Candidatus Bathyarchaeia archaeon]
MNGSIPEKPGVYTLIIEATKTATVNVGGLGAKYFPIGYYTYTGSALGEGASGLRGRITRHMRQEKKRRWHIDYLLSSPDVSIRAVVYSENSVGRECEIAQDIEGLEGVRVIVKGFGSSDCRRGCLAHLHHFPDSSEEGLIHTVSSIYGCIGLFPRVFIYRT